MSPSIMANLNKNLEVVTSELKQQTDRIGVVPSEKGQDHLQKTSTCKSEMVKSSKSPRERFEEFSSAKNIPPAKTNDNVKR